MHVVVEAPDVDGVLVDQLLLAPVDLVLLQPAGLVVVGEVGRFVGDDQVDPLVDCRPDHVHGGHEGGSDAGHFAAPIPRDELVAGRLYFWGAAGGDDLVDDFFDFHGSFLLSGIFNI